MRYLSQVSQKAREEPRPDAQDARNHLAERPASLGPAFDDVDDGATRWPSSKETSATLDELRAEARRAAEEVRAASTEAPTRPIGAIFSHFWRRIGQNRLPATPETITLCFADLRAR
jgi:hypothetical protein